MTNDRDDNRNPDGTFAEGNAAHTQHGGAGAVKAIQRGEPMRGIAAEKRLEIAARLESEGPLKMLEDCVIDFVTVAELYRNAVYTAHDSGDLDKLTGYVKTWLYGNGHAVRGLVELCKARGKNDGPTARDVLDSIKGGDNEQSK